VALQLRPVRGLDDPNQLRRDRETLNDILTFRFDASRIMTPAEIAAGVTPVNYAWPPGYVDRYATNSTPGTTDMTAAFNAAFKVANLLGCAVRWGATAPYRLNSPVNCTQMRGVIAYDESAGKLSNGVPSVIIAHTGHGFDLAASTEMSFHDICANNLSGTVPKTLFFMARNAAGSGAGIHRFYNIRTDANARFENITYNYASEETNWTDCLFYQNQPGSIIANHNGTNPSGYSSTFVTIATGSQSNVVHRYRGCTFFQLGNSGSTNESIFQLSSVGNLSCVDGSFYNPHGLAYVNVVGTGATFDIDFTNMRGEDDGANLCLYGYIIQTTGTTGASAHTNWTFKNCRAIAGIFLYLGDAAEMVGMDITVCAATSGTVLSAYLMSYSRVMHGNSIVTGRAGGAIQSNTFMGNRAQVTLSGTHILNTGFDQTLGRSWEDGDSYSAPNTACTGAITTSVIYTLTKFNRNVVMTLPAISATASATTNFAFGSAIPVAYRPAADIRIPIMIIDNGSAQVGVVIITASTGVMNVYKNPSSTGNFTAAAGAGLPGLTPISWSLP
jgi:hypothetical protein